MKKWKEHEQLIKMNTITEEELFIQKELESSIIQTFRILSSEQYLTDIQLQKVFEETSLILDSLNEQRHKIIAGICLLNGTFSLNVKFHKNHTYERRFTKYFDYIIFQLDILFKQVRVTNERSSFHKWIDESLFFFYFKYLTNDNSPWEAVLRTWLMLEKNTEQRKQYYTLLLTQYNETDNNRSLAFLTSLLALACDDGARSLQLIRTQKQLLPKDLFFHFQLFEQRQDWYTMKRWFTLFLPQWKNYTLDELQPFYEEMLVQTGDTANNLMTVWNKWLQRPTFQSFKSLIANYNFSERKQIIDYVLPSVEGQTSVPFGNQLYLKIVQHEKLYKKGIIYLLKYETNPLQLHQDKKEFILAVKKEQSELLLPLYHQFIIRLIEKKSRAHYEEAVRYMKELFHIYKLRKQEDVYKDYVERVKTTYKTYRALLQEMKKLDPYI